MGSVSHTVIQLSLYGSGQTPSSQGDVVRSHWLNCFLEHYVVVVASHVGKPHRPSYRLCQLLALDASQLSFVDTCKSGTRATFSIASWPFSTALCLHWASWLVWDLSWLVWDLAMRRVCVSYHGTLTRNQSGDCIRSAPRMSSLCCGTCC